jgi:putative endonuclease
MEKKGYVYLVANQRNGTLYLGVTSDLQKRVHEHKNKTYTGFSEKYGTDMLVWYETYENILTALEREKNIKNWKRAWKLKLIEDTNPQWLDLCKDL